MRSDDAIRIAHMLEAAREAAHFVEGKTRADLGIDRLLLLGLMKSIEIIGEAASKLSTEFRKNHPAIPWADIVGMRNRLIHAYFDIDPDILWNTVTKDIPGLIEMLEGIPASNN